MKNRDWIWPLALGAILGIGLILAFLNYVHLRDGYFSHVYQPPYRAGHNKSGIITEKEGDFVSSVVASAICPDSAEAADFYNCHNLKAQHSVAYSTASMNSWTAIATIFGALSALGIVVTILQSYRVVSEATKSNELLRKTFVTENRPWIIISRIEANKIEIKNTECIAHIDIIIKNIGIGLAKNIHMRPVSIASKDDRAEIGAFARNERLACAASPGMGRYLFPSGKKQMYPDGATYLAETWTVKWNITESNVTIICGNQFFLPQFAVSICYFSSFSDDLFQTVLLFDVREMCEGKPAPVRVKDGVWTNLHVREVEHEAIIS